MGTQPPLETLSTTDIEALVLRLESHELLDDDYPSLIQGLRLVVKLQGELASKQTSIARLRHLLFGPRSERRLPEPVGAEKSADGSGSTETKEPTDPMVASESEPDWLLATSADAGLASQKASSRLGRVGQTNQPGELSCHLPSCPIRAFWKLKKSPQKRLW